MFRPTLCYPQYNLFRIRGYHPVSLSFPAYSAKDYLDYGNWADPRSLAATNGISVDFFSSGYLDVSVLQVRFCTLCIQVQITTMWLGSPIRKSSDQSMFAYSPKLIASYYVLHRLLLPRHPPYALSHLTMQPDMLLFRNTSKLIFNAIAEIQDKEYYRFNTAYPRKMI